MLSATIRLGMETPEVAGMTLRQRVTRPQAAGAECNPGANALKAAHGYLSAEYATPKRAADAFGVDKQLANYYLRKLQAAGMKRVQPSPAAPASDPEPLNAQPQPQVDKRCIYEQAWVFAATV